MTFAMIVAWCALMVAMLSLSGRLLALERKVERLEAQIVVPVRRAIDTLNKIVQEPPP